MKKTVRRILSLVLCFALLIATVPTFVFAAGTASITIDGSSYSTGVDVATVTSVILPIKVEATNVNVADWKLTYDSNVFESATVSLATNIAGDVELKNAAIWWEADEVQNISGNFIDLTMVLKSGAALGDTTVSVAGTMTDDDYEDIDVDASVTLTIIDDSSATTDPYTANISTSATNNIVVNGQDIEVKVNVGGTTTEFSSAEIVLDYDPAYLTYKSAATSSSDAQAPDFEVDPTEGTVTIRDYGAAISAADGVYALNFTAVKGGNTNVSLNSAGFSTAEEAETDDLTSATIGSALALTINHKVTVNGTTSGSVAPTGSESYTGTITDYNSNFNYTVTATMGGETVDPSPTVDTDGKFTISNVTGDLVITYAKGDPKSYDVKWTGDTEDVDPQYIAITSATYGEDFTIAIPVNKEPTQVEEGANYTATVSVGDNVIQNLSNGGSYTIPGDAITGIITINVVKQPIPSLGSDDVTITVTGDAGVTIKEATGNSVTVDLNTEITLVLTPETGYTYSVVVGSGNPVTFTENEYSFRATETVDIIVTKTLDKDSVAVQKYIQLDGHVMWLVTINGNGDTEISGKTYSYSGNNMYWSSKYHAYCYLVVSDTLTVENATTAIGNALVNQSATAVDYTMDVNMSDIMDVNDAQLAWNMYNAKYDNFTDNVNVEKFLRADVNDIVGVNSTDAAAIIEAIKTA